MIYGVLNKGNEAVTNKKYQILRCFQGKINKSKEEEEVLKVQKLPATSHRSSVDADTKKKGGALFLLGWI